MVPARFVKAVSKQDGSNPSALRVCAPHGAPAAPRSGFADLDCEGQSRATNTLGRACLILQQTLADRSMVKERKQSAGWPDRTAVVRWG
jgi:hypothetical protein